MYTTVYTYMDYMVHVENRIIWLSETKTEEHCWPQEIVSILQTIQEIALQSPNEKEGQKGKGGSKKYKHESSNVKTKD